MADQPTVQDDDQHRIGEKGWTPAEQALMAAALEFYGAAERVIDLAGPERPRVRRDAAGFEAVRRAMGQLEERVAQAHADGVEPERIAELTRIEHETIALILGRRDAAPSRDDG
jgi:hypothetical protein